MRIFVQFNRLILGKIALSLSNFIVLYLLSNYLPAAFTGKFYYQVALLSTFSVFLSFGTDNALFVFVKKKIISTSNLVALGSWLLVFFLMLMSAALLLHFFYIKTDGLAVIFYSAFFWSCLMQNIFNAYLSSKGQGWKLQLVFILSNICFMGIIWFAVRSNRISFQNLLYAFCSINFCLSLAAISRIYYNTRPSRIFLPSRAVLKKLFRFGFLPYLSGSIFFLGANMDLFFVRQFCYSKLTVYVQAVKIFQMLCSVGYLLFYPFMGKIISSSYLAGIDILLKTGRIMIAALVLVLIPFYLLCYLFLPKIFPADTIQILNLLVLFSVGIVATGVAYLYTSYFIAMKKYRQNLISALIFLMTIAVLCLLLIPHIGVYGAALSYSFAILFSLFFDVRCVTRPIKVGFATAFLLKKDDIQYLKSIF